MTIFFRNARVLRAVFGVVFGLCAVGCEKYVESDSTDTRIASPDATTTVPAPTNTTDSAEPAITVPAPTNTTDAVLNDDPNCELVLKYQNRAIENDGQVHYVNRVLTSDPFESANPVCVQYNDTQSGDVNVWKDLSSTGQRIDVLPSDRGIDKIVVWYN